MPLTLEKYAELLDNRGEPRPAGPDPIPFEKVKPAIPRLLGLKAIILGGFGTSMLIQGGESLLLPTDPIQLKIALEKTIKEFKMWASMSRKPGEPSEYMEVIVRRQIDQLSMSEFAGKDTFPKMEKVWAGVLNTLMQKEYTYDVGMFGDLESYCNKISYYFMMSSQGVSIFEDMSSTLKQLAGLGIPVGIHIDAQSSGPVQLLRLLQDQARCRGLHEYFDPQLSVWAFQTGVRSSSERGLQNLLAGVSAKGLRPKECLYVGSDVERELIPAKRLGFRTAILLADRQSAKVTKEQLKEPRSRPDALLTKLGQLVDMAQVSQA